jgi:hypothetical protein
VLCQNQEEAGRVLSQLKIVIRTNYSNPPIHGGQVVAMVLNTPELRSLWEDELKQIARLRLAYVLLDEKAFDDALRTLDAKHDEAFAGVALAMNVMWPSQFLVSGLVLAATPMIAQLRGAGRSSEVGEVVRQGFWIVAVAATALMVFWRNAEFVYVALRIEPQTRAIALGYLAAASWGALPYYGSDTETSNAMALDTNQLMTAAGVTYTADYVQSLDESSLRNKLREYTQAGIRVAPPGEGRAA